MSENDSVQSLGTRPQKRELCRDFDPEKQRQYRIRAEQLAREILERKSK